MSFKFQHRVKIVYAFVLLSLALLISFVILIAINNKSFTAKVYYYTILDTAHGLAKKPSLFFKGYEIGRIDDFYLTQENKIHVNFYIYEEYQSKIVQYSCISKTTNPLSKDIAEFEIITPDYSERNHILVAEHDILPNIDSELGMDYMKKGNIKVPKIGIEGIILQFNQILAQFTQTNTADRVNDILQIIINDVLPTSVKTIKSYSGGQNLLEKIGGKQVGSIMDNLDRLLLNLKETLDTIHESRRELGPLLINTNKTLNEVQKTLEGVNNNPLIKNGISTKKKNLGVEINE